MSLDLVDISKRFGDVTALSGVSASFSSGKIHAVLGENGAGKSTLLRIAAGVTLPDAGTVRIEGTVLAPPTPRRATELGLGMVHQHFSILETLTTLENLLLGSRYASGPRVALDEGRAAALAALSRLGQKLDLDRPARELELEERQGLEIARLLLRGAKVLILDEPTAALAPPRVDALYVRLRALADEGATIIVVTHKLGEVVTHGDRAVILRKGTLVETLDVAPRDAETEARIRMAMMGSKEDDRISFAVQPRSARLARLAHVETARLRDLSLDIHAGEIVGVAGVEGNGQRDLAQLMTRELAPTRGSVELPEGAPGVVPEDRHKEGLVLSATVAENLQLGELARATRHGLIDESALAALAKERMDGIVPPDPRLPASALSGGNQQKILVARALARLEAGASLLVLSHPTRGVDFSARADIQRRIRTAIGSTKAAVLVSYDLDELRTLADRIVVLRNGRVAAELPKDASDDAIGRAMLGSRSEETTA